MSNPDSFIEEVTEEVRRDRLFRLMRRYGWIAVLAVLLLVGGASWREWRAAQDRAAAEALGDGILTALELPDPAARVAALQALPATGEARGLVKLLIAGEIGAEAAPELRAMADDPSLPLHYTHLAALKLVMIEGRAAAPDARLQTLSPLAKPGRPFRPLALEQMALAEIDAGNTAAALSHLRALVEDAGASAGLRQRASQLIVALGGGSDEG
ncbi:hypothetical protein [Rhodovulum sp.]|uniref:hypothetical protein n=1 Tax=Rhodovulum sp. TaxID=34009 RepID=UPI00178E9DAF|nr:hypothetical protein [Rhodovulum sp.]HDR28215.1 hypothetical protein [Rhodovulum sp.]